MKVGHFNSLLHLFQLYVSLAISADLQLLSSECKRQLIKMCWINILECQQTWAESLIFSQPPVACCTTDSQVDILLCPKLSTLT